ncbi:unnamed protein product [Nezara viridula]|uniref:Uncharacterized protein n=1 Tax=Nezara viridula TaxID=85310 RepID=A0A9P0MH90_NEZVI|nr:unnamed protein product [Nezara viridula]
MRHGGRRAVDNVDPPLPPLSLRKKFYLPVSGLVMKGRDTTGSEPLSMKKLVWRSNGREATASQQRRCLYHCHGPIQNMPSR